MEGRGRRKRHWVREGEKMGIGVLRRWDGRVFMRDSEGIDAPSLYMLYLASNWFSVFLGGSLLFVLVDKLFVAFEMRRLFDGTFFGLN